MTILFFINTKTVNKASKYSKKKEDCQTKDPPDQSRLIELIVWRLVQSKDKPSQKHWGRKATCQEKVIIISTLVMWNAFWCTCERDKCAEHFLQI